MARRQSIRSASTDSARVGGSVGADSASEIRRSRVLTSHSLSTVGAAAVSAIRTSTRDTGNAAAGRSCVIGPPPAHRKVRIATANAT